MLTFHDGGILLAHLNTIFMISGITGRTMQRKCEKFEIEKQKWESIADILHPVWNSCGAVLGDKIYIFGGSFFRDKNVSLSLEARSAETEMVQEYSLNMESW